MPTVHDVAAALSLLALALPAAAGDDGAPAEPPASDVEQDAKPEAKKVLARQMFKNLRFQEDWSALADPAVQTDHWLPDAKWIELAEGWALSTGGQFRYQWKDATNLNLTGTFPDHDEFGLVRTRVHADLRMEDDARIFVEGLSADVHGKKSTDPPPSAIDKNDWDFLNMFIELMDGPDFRFRYGRTEMQYGAQRLISPLDWSNTRRTFEGGVLATKDGNRSTDLFVTHPVVVDPRHDDESNESRWFSGLYNAWALEGGRTADAYLLHLHEGDPVIAGGDATLGDADVYTLGGRYAGKSGAFDWDAEAAAQRGQWSGDAVRAGMASVAGGFTMADLPGAPRLGLDLDWASGDGSSTDSTRETFNQLFPLGHAYFGYIDLVGRQNIVSLSPNARWKLGDTAWFRAAWFDFNLENDSDSLYNAGGAPLLTDTTGGSGSHVGQEWDLTLGWTPPCMSPHGEFLFGYSYFVPGAFVERLGDGDRAQLLYVQYVLNF
jgi:hypothetical protein